MTVPEEAAKPETHWLVNRDFGWACQGCDWTSAKLDFDSFRAAHERPDTNVPF